VVRDGEIDAVFGQADRVSTRYQHRTAAQRVLEAVPSSAQTFVDPAIDPNTELARCFLRLANHYAFDRLSRCEATLWRHVGQILFALDALDRRKPQERRRRFRVGAREGLPPGTRRVLTAPIAAFLDETSSCRRN
jgi:hypothetical protein